VAEVTAAVVVDDYEDLRGRLERLEAAASAAIFAWGLGEWPALDAALLELSAELSGGN